MYLSKLKLHGFKSFADQTVLEFDPGITAIVGPNGCGKSNIVDAVRWVIGEQRPSVLRSDKMENVIFNGTANRRPIGMSEVELTIQNTRGVLPVEYSEVTLGRRLYRSGESDYLMNQTKSRLKDIRNLFMDTGMGANAYSVIELSMVDEILSENADDRRHLFEEAAGITKYKRRRRQALRRLDDTQSDLARVRDLTDEVGKQVRRLEKQAEKAQQYQERDARLRELELALAQVDYDRLEKKRRRLKGELETIEERVEEQAAKLAKGEARLESLRTTQVEQEQTLTTRQQDLNEHLENVRELETERRLEQERLEAARRDLERTRQEQQQAEARRKELKETRQRLAGELETVKPDVEEAESVLAEARAERDRKQAASDERREALQALRRREEEAGEEQEKRRRALDRLTNRLDLLVEDRERLQEEAGKLDEQAGELAEREQRASEEQERAREAVEAARQELDEAEALREKHEAALEEVVEERRSLERRHDAAGAEVELLESLTSSYDEFSDAVQFLADSPAWSEELTTVADVLGCEEEHRLALDAALGDWASCIVVQDEEEVHRALQLLRNEEQGQATFLVMNRLSAGERSAGPSSGSVTPLERLVRPAAPAYRPLAELLLQEVYYTGSLEQAEALAGQAHPPACFVTPEGEWVRAGGMLHGGSRTGNASPAAGRFGRREQLEAAYETQEQLAEQLAAQEQAVADAESALEAVPFSGRRAALTEAEEALRAAEKSSDRLTYERETHDRRQQQVGERLEEIEEELEEGHKEAESLSEAASASEEKREALRQEREAAEEAFQKAEAASREAVSRHSDAQVAAVEARSERDNLRRDLARTSQDLEDIERRTGERADYLEELQEKIAASRARQEDFDDQIEEVHRDRSGLDEAVNQARADLTQTKSTISKLEGSLRKGRGVREKALKEENQRHVRLAEVKTRIEDLLEGIAEDYGRSLVEAPIQLKEDFDEDAARQDVQQLRSDIQSLGSVNPLALEEYEEESERLEFLQSQKEDLEQAEKTLLETIDEINATASNRFEETYEAIRSNFSRLFAELFGRGAKADLALEDPDDSLESPIQINAKPRGKRPVSITQLSSGEKTLTAIALLFAIYLVKPSPFCILDEVDAPLDDMNVERFMELIRGFAEDTQFILVTHNKLTMEAADRLYGVTMQEQGVSKLVGVQFDEAVAMAE